MPRRRQYTETFGLRMTVKERDVMQAYLKQRKLTASEYLRAVAIAPIVNAVRPLLNAAEGERIDGDLRAAAE